MDHDSKLIGGPYNGNSVNIPEDQHEYRLMSFSHSQAISHVYVRSSDRTFTYKETHTDAIIE